jgi:hypothetical protein
MTPGRIPNPTGSFKVFATNRDDKTSYNFFMKVTLSGGMVYWANVGGIEQFTLEVVCAEMDDAATAPTNPVTLVYDSVTTSEAISNKADFFVANGAGNCAPTCTIKK